MNEREFHGLLRDWLGAEAPREAPDWLIQQVLERTDDSDRRTTRGFWRPPRQLAMALLVLGLLVIGGVAALYGFLPRPPVPEPTPRAHVLRDIPAGVGSILAVTPGPGGIWVASSSLPGAILLDPETGEKQVEVQTHDAPPSSLDRHPLATDVVFAFDSIWTVDDEFGTITRIDPETARRVATIEVGPHPRVATAAAGALWVLSPLEGVLTRVDPVTEGATQTSTSRTSQSGNGQIAGTDDGVWVAIGDELLSFDPQTGQVVRTVSIGEVVSSIAVDEDVWATSQLGLSRVDRATGQIMATIDIGDSPGAMAIAGDLVWVADARDGTLRGVDPDTNTVVETLAVGTGATDISVSGLSMAVLNQIDRTVTVIRLAAE
jgi:glutamine cyclotransferase